jgi:hypothetical protein
VDDRTEEEEGEKEREKREGKTEEQRCEVRDRNHTIDHDAVDENERARNDIESNVPNTRRDQAGEGAA